MTRAAALFALPTAWPLASRAQSRPALIEWGDNVMQRFDPATETFTPFELPRQSTNIRQILGRPGEVWLPESGTEHITVIRTG